jgi:hypothetical protein
VEVKYYKLDVGGNPLIDKLDGILETLRVEMEENLEPGGAAYTIEAIEMTEAEYGELPEWDGP